MMWVYGNLTNTYASREPRALPGHSPSANFISWLEKIFSKEFPEVRNSQSNMQQRVPTLDLGREVSPRMTSAVLVLVEQLRGAQLI